MNDFSELERELRKLRSKIAGHPRRIPRRVGGVSKKPHTLGGR